MGNNDLRRPPRPLTGDGAFDASYFANCCGRPYCRDEHWLAAFGRIADRVVSELAPRRVLDAGCALGMLVEALRQRQVEAYGVDISSYAIEHVHESVTSHCRHGSIAEAFDQRYDLIVCIEVVEHMPPREAEAAIANICRHTDDVLFSSSPSDHREPTHVNVHPPEHWACLFAREGFVRDVDYDATFVSPWAARFRRRSGPLPEIVRDYERHYWKLANERGQLRSHVGELFAEAEGLRAQVAQLESNRHELARANERLLAAQAEVSGLRDRVAAMERSWFWAARRLWLKLKRPFT